MTYSPNEEQNDYEASGLATPGMTFEALNVLHTWVARNLPARNRAVLDGKLSVSEFIHEINQVLNISLPRREALNHRVAKQLLILLGLIGSSAERHSQQSSVINTHGASEPRFQSRADSRMPGRALGDLRFSNGLPFREYFGEVADFIGHPHRDTVVTLVELNGPKITLMDQVTNVVHFETETAFSDNYLLTFSTNPTEFYFSMLLKETIALQTLANEKLDAILASSDIRAPSALRAALIASSLMLSMRTMITRFLRLIPFDTDFFLDEFRQYQCPWSDQNSLRPPSAANDSASVLRDVLLFEELVPRTEHWPGYRAHAQRVGEVLLPEQRRRIAAAIRRDSLEVKIRNQIPNLLRVDTGARKPRLDRENTLTQAPWIGAYLRLYNAQASLSHAHYGLVRKYILAPKSERQENHDIRENRTVVDNSRGTTGMDPLGIMVELDESRHHHLLNDLNRDRSLRNALDRALTETFQIHPDELSPIIVATASRPNTTSPIGLQAWEIWEAIHE